MTLHTSHKPQSVPARHETLLLHVGAQKDRDAFVELFHYFAPRIKSYLLKHGADETTAEEIAQNTMISVWEKASSYDPKKAAASTWIFTIARNKRIDALRKDRFIDVNSDSLSLANASYENVEEYADNKTIDNLSSALGTLPPEQAQLVRMAFFEDKSHQSIARETHLPLGTVKSRLRLALEKLRHLLKLRPDQGSNVRGAANDRTE